MLDSRDFLFAGFGDLGLVLSISDSGTNLSAVGCAVCLVVVWRSCVFSSFGLTAAAQESKVVREARSAASWSGWYDPVDVRSRCRCGLVLGVLSDRMAEEGVEFGRVKYVSDNRRPVGGWEKALAGGVKTCSVGRSPRAVRSSSSSPAFESSSLELLKTGSLSLELSSYSSWLLPVALVDLGSALSC